MPAPSPLLSSCCTAPLAFPTDPPNLITSFDTDVIAGGGGPMAVDIATASGRGWHGETEDQLQLVCSSCGDIRTATAGDAFWEQFREPHKRFGGLGPGFADAVLFATEVHHAHWRKGTEVAYISHLLATASNVLYLGGDQSVAIAALLHDAVEDRPHLAPLEMIEQRFGPYVARLVAAVTEPPKSEAWANRKEAYEAHLRVAEPEALLISLADKAHNLQSLVDDLCALGPSVWERFNAGPTECLDRYQRLMDLFRERIGDRDRVRGVLARMERDLATAKEFIHVE